MQQLLQVLFLTVCNLCKSSSALFVGVSSRSKLTPLNTSNTSSLEAAEGRLSPQAAFNKLLDPMSSSRNDTDGINDGINDGIDDNTISKVSLQCSPSKATPFGMGKILVIERLVL